MKARPAVLLFLGLVLLFAVTKLLPKSGGDGASRENRPAAMPGEDERPSSRARRTAARSLDPPVMSLDRLEIPASGEAFAIGRNLFRYGAPKPPQSPPGAAGGKPGIWRPGGGVGQPAPDAPLTPPPPPVDVTPPKPQPPPVTVRFLGAFGPKGRMLAVFTDGGEIYNVFEGETFATRYVLRRINLETVELGFVGFPDDQIEKLEVGP